MHRGLPMQPQNRTGSNPVGATNPRYTRPTMTKTRKAWLSDAPPRPWLLWTVRGLITGVWVLLLLVNLPSTIERFNNIRSMTPPGPERQAALDSLIENAVITLLVMPLLLLVIFGFGVFPRKATDVWNSGGPWFAPMWRSEKKQRSGKRPPPSEG
jgi:hypothetical protein